MSEMGKIGFWGAIIPEEYDGSASDAAVRAADMTLKIFGSYGYSMEYPIQRFIRDSRAFCITEGTSNIQKLIIARNLLNP